MRRVGFNQGVGFNQALLSAQSRRRIAQARERARIAEARERARISDTADKIVGSVTEKIEDLGNLLPFLESLVEMVFFGSAGGMDDSEEDELCDIMLEQIAEFNRQFEEDEFRKLYHKYKIKESIPNIGNNNVPVPLRLTGALFLHWSSVKYGEQIKEIRDDEIGKGFSLAQEQNSLLDMKDFESYMAYEMFVSNKNLFDELAEDVDKWIINNPPLRESRASVSTASMGR